MSVELLAVLALVLLAFGAVSRLAERSIVSAPMVFVALGYAVSGRGLGLLECDHAAVIHGLAEITLMLVLFADAVRIDLSALRRERSLPLRLLGIGMPLTLLLGAGVAALLFPDLSTMEWLLIAAILAPTDAALGQAVVSSPLVPLRIRQTLNVESGLNDGIALPVVLIAAALAGMQAETNVAADWIRFVALQVTVGPAVGIAVGFLSGRALGAAKARGWLSDGFGRLSIMAVAILAFSAAELVAGNGFIAAFTAGATIGNTSRNICGSLFEFGEEEGLLLTLIVFLLFGATMLPDSLAHLSLATVGYAFLSLTVIRMIPVALSLIGSDLRPVSFAFLGWFGPRGLASILFVLLVVEEMPVTHSHEIEAVVAMTVLASTFAHGITAFPFARRYGEKLKRDRHLAEVEHADCMTHPVRTAHAAHPGGTST